MSQTPNIVERLRSRKLCKDGVSRQPEKVKREAADTIEALRSEAIDLQATIVRLTRELGAARDYNREQAQRQSDDDEFRMMQQGYRGQD